MVKQPIDNIKIKDDLEILIRLYYNYRILKEKENKEFNFLNEDNSNTMYLINNNWIEKYKSFYEYNDLVNYLKTNKNDKVYTINEGILSKEYIDNFISNLPSNYINKKKKKNLIHQIKLISMRLLFSKEHKKVKKKNFHI